MDSAVIFDMYKRGMSISRITDMVYKHKNIYFRDKYFTGESIEYKKYTKDECRKMVCEIILAKL